MASEAQSDAEPSSSQKKIPRPMNSFMIFSNQYRTELRATNSELSNKQVSQLLGAKWASLTPNEKEHYAEG
jgi:hypothetical protein